MGRQAKFDASEFERTIKGVWYIGYELYDLDEKEKALAMKTELESSGMRCKLIKKAQSKAWYGSPTLWLLLVERK